MRDLVLLLVVVLAFRRLKQQLLGPFDLSHALVVWVLDPEQELELEE